MEEKQDISIFFKPLSYEDIEEKIQLNIMNFGYTFLELKTLFELELSMIEREILKKKYIFLTRRNREFLFYYQDFMQDIFNQEAEAQNLKEQINYLNNKILKEIYNGNISNVSNNIHDKDK